MPQEFSQCVPVYISHSRYIQINFSSGANSMSMIFENQHMHSTMLVIILILTFTVSALCCAQSGTEIPELIAIIRGSMLVQHL